VSTNDLETSVVGVESFTDDKSDKGGVVSSEEVTTAGFEFPVVDFMDFSETFSEKLLTRVVDNVERRRTVVDEVDAVKSDWLSVVDKVAFHGIGGRDVC
jgi:isocitrate lyase